MALCLAGPPTLGTALEFARSRRSAADREQFTKQPLGLAQTLLSELDRLGLADRVGDEALLVETVHRGPVKPLPSPAAIVQAEVEQGQDRLVDPVGVDLHRVAAPRGRQFDTLRRDYTTPEMSTNAATVLTGRVRTQRILVRHGRLLSRLTRF